MADSMSLVLEEADSRTGPRDVLRLRRQDGDRAEQIKRHTLGALGGHFASDLQPVLDGGRTPSGSLVTSMSVVICVSIHSGSPLALPGRH